MNVSLNFSKEERYMPHRAKENIRVGSGGIGNGIEKLVSDSLLEILGKRQGTVQGSVKTSFLG